MTSWRSVLQPTTEQYYPAVCMQCVSVAVCRSADCMHACMHACQQVATTSVCSGLPLPLRVDANQPASLFFHLHPSRW